MKSIVKKISRALQVILMAPVKLPAKIAGVLKYVALGLGVIESVLDGDDKVDSEETKESPKLEVGNSDKAQEIDEVEPVEDHDDQGLQSDPAELGLKQAMPENNPDRDQQIKKANLSEESALLEETSDLHDPGKETGHEAQ